MGESSKESAVAVVPAAVSTPEGKSARKGKRNAGDDIEMAVIAKKQKPAPEKVVCVNNDASKVKELPPKKGEGSSVDEDSPDSEEKIDKKTSDYLLRDQVMILSRECARMKEQIEILSGEVAVLKRFREEDGRSGVNKQIEAVQPKKAAQSAKQHSSDDSSSDQEQDKSDMKAAQSGRLESSDDSGDESSFDKSFEKLATYPPLASNGSEKDDEDDEDSASSVAAKLAPKVAKKGTSIGNGYKESSDAAADGDEGSDELAKTPMKKKSSVESSIASKASAIKSVQSEPKTPASSSQVTASKTLFVGNLTFTARNQDVKNFFQEAGEVVNIRFATYMDGSSRGYAHVDFGTTEAAKKALALNGNILNGRPVMLELAHEQGTYIGSWRDNNSFKKHFQNSSNTVFIRGFDLSLREDQIRSSLQEHFGLCGEITRVSIPKCHETGAIKGIAYMDFSDQSSLSKACRLNGSDLGGVSLHVVEAKPKPDNSLHASGRDLDPRFRGEGGWVGRGRGGGTRWCLDVG